jgi:hypothetical protein
MEKRFGGGGWAGEIEVVGVGVEEEEDGAGRIGGVGGGNVTEGRLERAGIWNIGGGVASGEEREGDRVAALGTAGGGDEATEVVMAVLAGKVEVQGRFAGRGRGDIGGRAGSLALPAFGELAFDEFGAVGALPGGLRRDGMIVRTSIGDQGCGAGGVGGVDPELGAAGGEGERADELFERFADDGGGDVFGSKEGLEEVGFQAVATLAEENGRHAERIKDESRIGREKFRTFIIGV